MTDDAPSWPQVVMGVSFGMGFLVLVTVVMVVTIRAYTRHRTAQAALARDDAYRKLAEQYDAHLTRAATHEREVRAELAFVRARVEAIESLLRSVE